jgi:putative peptide zinc metalloprotease protein
MNRTTNAFLAAVLTIGLAWGGSTAARAQEIDVGGGGDNTAIALNTRDGSTRFRLSFRIVRTNADVVDNDNAAVAIASCTDCRTIAVAFQVVLVFSEPSTLTTDNLAIAMNIECTDCETLASAYQWVLGTDGRVHFSPEGNRAIAGIRQALHDLVRSDLPIDELQAQLDQLADQLEAILAQELVAAGPPGAASFEEVPAGDGLSGLEEAGGEAGGTEPAPGITPSPEMSPGTTDIGPSPTESPSESPTPTPAPSVSPTA